MGFSERIYIVEILRGLWVTSRHFFTNLFRHSLRLLGLRAEPGAVTLQYPDVPARVPPRARGRHRLLLRDDGTPRCVACMLCETICPASCIRIIAEESPDISIEKRAKSFEIDLGVCVYCGYCVEACPEDAIRMDSGQVEMCAYTREGLRWNLRELSKLPDQGIN
jgi:NADH-quinone oxidoreductase subunit I